MSEQQETQWTPEEQHALDFPAENLTGFDYDDITIWGTKTNPADLTPEEVTKMWFVVQRYRRELVEEGARTDAELAALRADAARLREALTGARDAAFSIGQIADYPADLGFMSATPHDVVHELGKRGYQIYEALAAIVPERGDGN